MKRLPLLAFAIAVTSFCFFTTGCDQPASSSGSNTSGSSTEDHGHDHDGEGHEDHDGDSAHGHDHGHIAPHGGQIIELGREHKYHAEITDDHDSETITVFMLDGDMKGLKVDSETISLTLISGDESKTFEMTAAEQTDEDSSAFTTKDEAAFELLESEDAEGKVRVKIDGKPYTGTFKH